MTRSAVGAALVLFVAAIVQSTLIAFLPGPLVALAPVTVAVLAIAHGRGVVAGGVAGLWAGLMVDVLPPAAGPFGGWMLLLCLAGLGMGHAVVTGRPGPFGSMVLISIGCGLTVLARGLVMWFAGAPVRLEVLEAAAWAMAWSLVLAPLALMLVAGPRRGSTARRHDSLARLRDPEGAARRHDPRVAS